MGIFNDNTIVNPILLEDKIFMDDDYEITYIWNQTNNIVRPAITDEIELSQTSINYYPKKFKYREIQKQIEPKSNIITRMFDYRIKHKSISFTWNESRKTLHMSDLLKPEFYKIFQICNNIPEGLLRIGITDLQILPESIPDGDDFSNNDWVNFFMNLFSLVGDKVQSSFQDNYKCVFKVDKVYTGQCWRRRILIHCSFEIISIGGKSCSWWGWSKYHNDNRDPFNLRANPVKLQFECQLQMPDFLKLKKNNA